MRAVPRVAVLVAFVCVGSAPAETADPQVVKAWKSFRAAVANSDARAVADMTHFPFRHPALEAAGEPVTSRKLFLARFTQIFTAGIRKQVAKGTPVAVTPETIQEAKDAGETACGEPGDWVVQLPPDQRLDLGRDDEAYLRLAFRVIEGKVLFHRILACN